LSILIEFLQVLLIGSMTKVGPNVWWKSARQQFSELYKRQPFVDNGQWFLVSYDSANKQERYKKPLH